MLLFAGTSLPPRIYQSDVETVHRLEEDEFFDLEKRKASGTERFFAALQNDSVRKAKDTGGSCCRLTLLFAGAPWIDPEIER